MSDWKLVYDRWEPERQPLREALCTLGNGYFATRGAFEEASARAPHYPGTYLAGGYNRRVSCVEGREIENEDLVNWPNWLCLSFRPADGDWLTPDSCEIREFRQELDLQCGILERSVRLRDAEGRETSLRSRRLVHMDNCHLAAIHWTLTPENWSGALEIRSAIDASVRNEGVERYRDLRGDHLETLARGHHDEDRIVYLLARTRQSRLRMAQAARTRVGPGVGSIRRRISEQSTDVTETITCQGEQSRAIEIEKTVAIYNSRDRAISEELSAACETAARAPSFDELTRSHARAWASLWDACDIEIGGHPRQQLALRLHVFHLLQTVSPHTIDLDVGVPPRGLHGEAYRGHVFWDELFVFPFLNQSLPELTRALLLYRYRRLPAARRNARDSGFRGALYPWQSGSDGSEESQEVHLNPRSGRWNPDETHLQRHVNSAIAYNVWQYYQTTEDREFMASYGAEMILEIARLWSSLATHNPERDRFEIRGVVGPDEYHTRYPDRTDLGLDNNAYTNFMAAWVLRRALIVLDHLDGEARKRLCSKLSLEENESDHWDEVSRRMYLPFLDDGVLEQFEGYNALSEFDWEGYRRKYGNIQRLDRILEAEEDTPNRYKASKQADVLMLLYLFSTEELAELFAHMNYSFDPEMIPHNIDYYARRTSHGSTLSRVVHSWVLARANREGSWGLFEDALRSDLEDIQGGTTHEGIHLGAMSGTTDLVQRGYVGVELRDEALCLNPCLPGELTDVRFRIRYRGHWVTLHARQDEMTVSFDSGWTRKVEVSFRGHLHTMGQGESRTFSLR